MYKPHTRTEDGNHTVETKISVFMTGYLAICPAFSLKHPSSHAPVTLFDKFLGHVIISHNAMLVDATLLS